MSCSDAMEFAIAALVLDRFLTRVGVTYKEAMRAMEYGLSSHYL